MFRLVVLMSFLVTNPVYADVTLYACDQGDHAILQDKPIPDCENLQTYHYQSFESEQKPKTTLREGEIRLLEQLEQDSLSKQHNKGIDGRVGDALMQRELDRRFSHCHVFRQRIEQTLVEIERRPVDHYLVRQAVPALMAANRQHFYYCGEYYPGLKEFTRNIQFHH